MENLTHILDDLIKGIINIEDAKLQISDLYINNKSNCKCPVCSKEMYSIELTHYKCKKCNLYFTN